MIRNRIASALVPALLLPAALVAWAPRLAAQQTPDPGEQADEQDAEVGESPERYAQVKVVEGSVVIHKGETDEALTRGVPVAEGDVVESDGRGILQLGDGSALAFGPGTRFKVAALFSEQDQVRRVLLVLERGQLRLRKGTLSDAEIRVDTPAGTAVLGNRGNARSNPDVSVEVSPDPRGARVVYLVHGGQAGFSNASGRAQVFAGQRLTVYGNLDALDRVADFNAYALDDFDQWAEGLVKPRPSASAARVPPELRYYADSLDSTGRWVYVDDCASWCWAPTVATPDWRPYCDGRWGAYGGGLTWISDEPWGYVTYHHGRWGWAAGLGWYWIPGVFYSPAWVAWNCSGSFFGWAPLGFRNRPCRWGYGPWAGGYAWNVVDVRYANDHNLRRHCSSDPGVVRMGGAPGGRTWFMGRVVVDRGEFRDPLRFQRVVGQPGLNRQRVAAYAQAAQTSTGRTLIRPLPTEARVARETGFTRMERPAGPAVPTTTVLLNPLNQPQSGSPRRLLRPLPGKERITLDPRERPENRPRQLPPEERPRLRTPAEERPQLRTPAEERPRMERPRPEPGRVAPFIPERREAPRREAPAADQRQAPRMEAPRQEARPAPKPEMRAEPKPEPRREKK